MQLQGGRLLPNSPEIEEAVLSAMLSDRELAEEILGLIRDEETFYQEKSQKIYLAAQNLAKSGRGIDSLTITEEMAKLGTLDGIGGIFTLAELAGKWDYSRNVADRCRILIEKWVLRETITQCFNVANKALEADADAFTIVEDLARVVDGVSFKNVSKEFQSLESQIFPTLQQIEEERKRKDGLNGISSGLSKIDDTLHGWKAPDLIILGARPAVGKTALALNFAYHASIEKPVAFFSYEMSNEQLIRRLFSIDTKVNYGEVVVPNRMGDANWKKLQEAGLDKRQIYLNDDRNVTTTQMQSMCRRLQKKKGLGLVIVDYLQLMPGEGKRGNREQEIAQISRSLKGLAKDLSVPVIALSQLSRDIEKSNREPLPSDLRESGAIEQDADIVAFLYGATEAEIKEDASKKSEVYLKIAKHRGGELKKLLFYKDLSIQSFFDYHQGVPNFSPMPDPQGYGKVKVSYDDIDDDELLPF